MRLAKQKGEEQGGGGAVAASVPRVARARPLITFSSKASPSGACKRMHALRRRAHVCCGAGCGSVEALNGLGNALPGDRKDRQTEWGGNAVRRQD